MDITFDAPNAKQAAFIADETHRHLGFGGARGGGKSWAVRTKATLLALKYPNIKQLIIRRTYPELTNNHIEPLKQLYAGMGLLPKFVKYNDNRKEFRFFNNSVVKMMYCDAERDLLQFQGTEWDIIYIDEATQLSESQLVAITATLRGVNEYPKQIVYTCNPGGQSHSYFKRIFVDKKYKQNERGEDYAFIQSLVTDNHALMESDPEYLNMLKALPERLRDMWLYGRWDIFEGMFFEDFRTEPDIAECQKQWLTVEDAQAQGRWTHVIAPLPIERIRAMKIYRSYDFGYNKPFSVGWWGVDSDGIIYRIHEWYGCTGEANVGTKLTPNEQFEHIREIESTHPYLKDINISGIADPSIWDKSRGEAIADIASKYRVYFVPGDNKRIPGWMQCHYRLMFDDNGYPMMYVFDTCKEFIRTVPTLQYSKTKPEDLDTEGEDHIADEWRYFCMSRPIKPPTRTRIIEHREPLDFLTDGNSGLKKWSDYY